MDALEDESVAPKPQLDTPADGAAHEPLAIGARINGFQIRSVLGVGNFAITYRALDHELERPVAIKEYLPARIAARAADGDSVQAISPQHQADFEHGLHGFIDEARALAQVTEVTVVRVLRCLEANGTGYLVMNLEHGTALADVLANGPSVTEKRLRALGIHLLRGLHAVHRQRLFHRDVRPANILMRRAAPPLLLDFGGARHALARRLDGDAMTIDPSSLSDDGGLGPWTDLYGLGATLYECAVRQAPPALAERTRLVSGGAADPVSTALNMTRDFLGDEFIGVVEWLMQPRAVDRPQSAREVLQALRLAPVTPDSPTVTSPAAAAAPNPVPRTDPNASQEAPLAARDTAADAATATGTGSLTWGERLRSTLFGSAPQDDEYPRDLAGGESSGWSLRGGGHRDDPPAPTAKDVEHDAPASISDQERGDSTDDDDRYRSALRGHAELPENDAFVRPSAAESDAAIADRIDLPTESVAHIKRLLIERLGPVAAMLADQSAARSDSAEQWVSLMAEVLEDDERAAFVSGCAKWLRRS